MGLGAFFDASRSRDGGKVITEQQSLHQSLPGNTIRLADRKVYSDSFLPFYREGMDLVEEAASYLDGDGREESRGLSNEAAALYASESMRLTSRLMQIASWLLLQRAARNGEMSRAQVTAEKNKLRLNTPSAEQSIAGWSEMPDRFVDLIEHSLRLQERVRKIDQEVYGELLCFRPPAQQNPVSQQLVLLKTAFGAS
ncbi:hypothetical protein ACI0FR_02134 [Paenochrobactrum sp. BZR 201-1]